MQKFLTWRAQWKPEGGGGGGGGADCKADAVPGRGACCDGEKMKPPWDTLTLVETPKHKRHYSQPSSSRKPGVLSFYFLTCYTAQ